MWCTINVPSREYTKARVQETTHNQQIFIFSTVRDVGADPRRQRRGQRQWIRTPAAGFYGRRVAGLYCCVVTLLDAAFPSQGEGNTPPEGFKTFLTSTAPLKIVKILFILL
jgi:hypothetical protein